MSSLVTTRWQLPYPADTDPAAIASDIQALATALDNVAMDDQGTLGARGSAGRRGRYYWATDIATLFRDTGSNWVAINPALAVDGAPNLGTVRTLGTGSQQAAAGNDTRLSDKRVPVDRSVDSPQVADTLKPSAGAANAIEALRAIGLGTGQVAAGADTRFPTAAQKSALAGTSGSPADTNRYVTDQDPRFPTMPQIGFLMLWGGAGDPNTSWLLCDGRELDRVAYATLYAKIGLTYGRPSSGSVFKIPDLRGSVAVGPDNMGTAVGAANRIPNSNRTLGAAGGEERHAMTLAELIAHAHAITVNNAGGHNHGGATTNSSISHSHQSSDGHAFLTDHAGGGGVYNLAGGTQMGNGGGGFTSAADAVHGHGINTDGDHGHVASAANSGGSTPFNVMQPYQVLNYVIRVL